MIGASVGVDDEVGIEVRPRRLDQDVHARRCCCPAVGLADDPAHRIARRDGSGADELFARLQRDVGDLAGGGIDLVERAVGERVDLDRVQVIGADRLHACRVIGLLDAQVRVGRLRRRMLASPKPLQLARQWQGLRQFDDLHRLRRARLQDRLARRVVVADRRRFPGCRAGAERSRAEQRCDERSVTHQPRSFDQLRART